MGHRLAARIAHRHFFAGKRMPVDRRIDGAARAVRHAPDEGPIAALHRPGAAVIGELRGQRLMRAVVLRHHHQARRVLVEPVHDAGAPNPADAGKAGAAMGDQRVYQRAGLVAGGGMHDQALRLVDDDNVLVLKDDIERDILALGLRRDGLGDVDCDRIAFADMISGVADGGAPGGDGTGEDQRLQPRARQFRAQHREHAVEPGRSLVAADGDLQLLSAIRSSLFQRRAFA